MTRNTETRRLQADGTGSAMILMGMASPELAELAIRAGASGIVLDMEHGFLDFGNVKSIRMACQAAGGTCLARLTAEMAPWLGPLADIGIDGVLLSGVRSFSEIDTVVKRLVLYPEGTRSVNPFVAAAGCPGDLAALRSSAGSMSIWAMAETAALLKEAREGGSCGKQRRLTGLMIGPYDLAGELGVEPSADDDKLVCAVGDFIDWSARHGCEWGMFVRDVAAMKAWAGHSIVPRTVIAGYDRDIWFNAVLQHTHFALGSSTR